PRLQAASRPLVGRCEVSNPARATPGPCAHLLRPCQRRSLTAEPGGDPVGWRVGAEGETGDAPAVVVRVAEQVSNPARGLEAGPLDLRAQPGARVPVRI